MAVRIYCFSGYEFDPVHALLRSPTDEISLEHRIASLLDYFCQHPQQALTKEALLDAVWAGRIVNEDSLSVAVSKLRKLLHDSRGEPQFIKTIPGVGYYWLPDTTLKASSTPSAAQNVDTQRVSASTVQRRDRYRWGLLSAVLLILVAVIYLLQSQGYLHPAAEPSSTASDQPAAAALLTAPAQAKFLEAQKLIAPAVYYESTPANYRRAIELFREVLQEYPDFTPAHVGIAEAKFEMSGLRGYRDLQLYLDEINSIVALALAQDPANGHALELKAKLAFLGEWDLETAKTYYEKAIEAMPNDPGVYLGYSELLLIRGRYQEADKLLNQLRVKNPDFYRYMNLSLVYMFKGDYPRAIAETQRLINSEVPSRQHNHILTRIGVLTHDDAMAMEHLEVLMREEGYNDQRIAAYRELFAEGGIAAVYGQLLEERNEDNLGQYIPPLSWARYAIVTGEYDIALRHIQDAIKRKQPQALILHSDPHYDPLRQSEEFQQLLAQLPN
ncbi:winged helix-turn-helix domain-containing protein [Pseudidiomarina sp. 1APR75-33.1]|uniref:winged helix-turn-helix domain-containing protein n=1 Tax=Pseudidiomarina terrestris TaxID=2820060 RepID=UPI002650D4A3|nr:winged helix-turn-helix domain-containing protein [Pseudidiomarina sp. 1APR75-33.1]MDN7128040.1 winged helix-turn-helix domain-containing protein [Pseudidiomarina sp. 1APR75-33.1]